MVSVLLFRQLILIHLCCFPSWALPNCESENKQPVVLSLKPLGVMLQACSTVSEPLT